MAVITKFQFVTEKHQLESLLSRLFENPQAFQFNSERARLERLLRQLQVLLLFNIKILYLTNSFCLLLFN